MNKLQLNNEQFERLKSYYIDRYIDNMSHEDLVDYVANEMYVSMNSLTELEIIINK